MINRLKRRRDLIIRGCIFGILVMGVACNGMVHAACCEVSISATGDGSLLGGSEWTWAASDGSLSGVPPAGPGQEEIRGSYSGQVLVTGQGTLHSEKSLSSDGVITFSENQQLESGGPGIFEESLSVDSCRSAASGVTCAAGSSAGDTENFTRSPYCEHAGTKVVFMTDSLGYRSDGVVSQGDLEIPDSLAMNITSSGKGNGAFIMEAGSMSGTAATAGPDYEDRVREEVRASGNIVITGKTSWTSCSSQS